MTSVPQKTDPNQQNAEPEADERFERRMSFAEHLDELRGNIIRSAYVLVGLMIVGFILLRYVEVFVTWPYMSVRESLNAGLGLAPDAVGAVPPLTSVDITEAFFFSMKVIFYAALLIGTPYFLYEMWRFISAGLHPHERTAVMKILPVSIGLFFIGAAFSYIVLVPISVEFMLTWSSPDLVKVEVRLDSYLSFFLILTLMLGVVFQLPMIQYVLARFGILPAAKQAEWRRGFIMAAVVAAAIITPTGDPVTLSLVAIPMLVLYEIGILIGKNIKPREEAT